MKMTRWLPAKEVVFNDQKFRECLVLVEGFYIHVSKKSWVMSFLHTELKYLDWGNTLEDVAAQLGTKQANMTFEEYLMEVMLEGEWMSLTDLVALTTQNRDVLSRGISKLLESGMLEERVMPRKEGQRGRRARQWQVKSIDDL